MFVYLCLCLCMYVYVQMYTTASFTEYKNFTISYKKIFGGARGVMVIVIGIGHDDTSSNPGRD